jgi:hypothetical protein
MSTFAWGLVFETSRDTSFSQKPRITHKPITTRRESVKAYVLIQTADAEPIGEALRLLPGVMSADNLRGPYDAIALVNSGSAEHPFDRILDDIKRLPGVARALTAPLVRPTAARPITPSPTAGSGEEAA